MKKSKLLTLSAALILVGTLTGCEVIPSSSSNVSSETSTSTSVSTSDVQSSASTSTISEVDILKDVADAIFQKFGKDYDGEFMTASLKLQKIWMYDGGKYKVNIEWRLEDVSGEENVFALQPIENDDMFINFYCAFENRIIETESKASLTATLTLNGVSKSLVELIGEDHGKIERKCLTVFSSHSEYMTKAKENKNEAITVRGIVSKKGTNGKNYIWLNDLDNEHAYILYKPKSSDEFNNVKEGDYVLASGSAAFYNGLRQIKDFNIAVYENRGTVTTPVDLTAEFTNSTTMDPSKDQANEFCSKVLNRVATIKNVTINKAGGYKDSYHYFTVGSNKLSLYWSTSYVLSKDENNTWKKLFDAAEGLKANVTGIVGAYTPDFTMYPYSTTPIEIVDTDQNIANKSAENLVDMSGFYVANKDVELPGSDVLGSTITWSLDAAADANVYKIDEGKLKIVPVADSMKDATLTATVKHGNATKTRTFTISSQVLTEEQRAQKAAEEIKNTAEAHDYVALPTSDTKYGAATISYAVKGDVKGVTIDKNGLVVFDKTAPASCTLTATVKIGEKTATKDITVTNVGTTSIADFLTAKDENNAKYVRGQIVAVGATKDKVDCVIYDGNDYVYVYSYSNDYKVGDEVVIRGIYKSYSSLPELCVKSTVEEDVVVIGTVKTLPTTATTTVTAETLSTDATAAKSGTKDEQNALNASNAAKYTGKLVEITEGYVVENSSGKYGIATTATATKYSINLYHTDFSSLEGKKVKVLGVCKGLNAKYGNISFIIVSVEVVE